MMGKNKGKGAANLRRINKRKKYWEHVQRLCREITTSGLTVDFKLKQD